LSITLAAREDVLSVAEVAPGEIGSNVEDAALAEAVAGGDRGALETAFEQYGGAVKSIAQRVLRDEGLAEDVVQDVFVAFWSAPDKYDPQRGSLRTFLVTLGHRRAVDTVRSEEARSRREERQPEGGAQPTVDEEVWARTLSETVRTALDGLPDPEREAITLAYFGGLSYVDVAARLGAPEGTVKSRIRSGMRKLSASMAGMGQ
jgi:RNA polymerase sigma-70 factor (ECF subfamily)